MKTTIKSIKDNYAIELPNDILNILKVTEDEDVEISIEDGELIINNIKIKPLSMEERLTIRSIKNDFSKLDWGKV